LWSLLLWRYSRLAWTRSSAACCRWPCFSRGIGLDDPQRSLPNPTILWFCDLPPADQCPLSLQAMSTLEKAPLHVLQCYCWAWFHMIWSISVVTLGHLSQLCQIPTSCPIPTYSLREQREITTMVMLCNHSSAIDRTSVCYCCCFGHRSETQPHVGC